MIKLSHFVRIKLLFTLTIFQCQIVESQVLQKNPVLELDFTLGATDRSGNCHVTKTTGAKLGEDRFGHSNSAYYFDGKDDIIEVDPKTVSDFNGYTGSYSVSVWVNSKDPTIGSNGARVLEKGYVGSSGYPYSIQVDTNSTAFFVLYDGTNTPNVSVKGAFDGNWHHLSFCVNAKTDSIYGYLDGVLVDSAKNSLTKNAYNQDVLKIGGNLNPPRYFQGLIDDIKLFDYALSPSEIKFLSRESVYDSTNVIMDTIQIFDTVFVSDTIYMTIYDTLVIYDSIKVYDTTTIYKFDTLVVLDTTYITLYDTIEFYDSISVATTDTLFIDVVTSGIPQLIARIRFYPNPAKDQLTMDFDGLHTGDDHYVEIVDGQGKVVFAYRISEPYKTIDVSAIGSKGTYTVRIKDQIGVVLSNKLIILR